MKNKSGDKIISQLQKDFAEKGIELSYRMADEITERYRENGLPLYYSPTAKTYYTIDDESEEMDGSITLEKMVDQVMHWDDVELSGLHRGTADNETIAKIEEYLSDLEKLKIGLLNEITVTYAFSEQAVEKYQSVTATLGKDGEDLTLYEEPRWNFKSTKQILGIIKENAPELHDEIMSYLSERGYDSEKFLSVDLGKSLRYDDGLLDGYDFSTESLEFKLDDRFIVRYSADGDDGNLGAGGDEIVITDKKLVSRLNSMIKDHVIENMAAFEEFKKKRDELIKAELSSPDHSLDVVEEKDIWGLGGAALAKSKTSEENTIVRLQRPSLTRELEALLELENNETDTKDYGFYADCEFDKDGYLEAESEIYIWDDTIEEGKRPDDNLKTYRMADLTLPESVKSLVQEHFNEKAREVEKELVEKRMLENGIKKEHVADASRGQLEKNDAITNYVLEKFSKAGIEVVTDKAKFERILAREEILQKTTKEGTPEKLFKTENNLDLNPQIDSLTIEDVNLKDDFINISEKTPFVFKECGLDDFPVNMYKQKLARAFFLEEQKFGERLTHGHKGEFSSDTVKEVFKNLGNPRYVFNSKLDINNPDNFYLIGVYDQLDEQKNPMVISLHFNKNRKEIEANWITSIYGKRKEVLINDWTRKGYLIYMNDLDMEKAPAEVVTLQMRVSKSASAYINNIKKKSDFVNDFDIAFMRQGETTYGFAHEGKIYLNPDVMNSNVAVHEYTHLWDAYTQKMNPELWEKGLNIFRDTSIWNEVLNDEHYTDIKDDENLVLSECHARICGKIAESVLQKVLERDGDLKKAEMLDWSDLCFDYIYRNFDELIGKDTQHFISSVSEAGKPILKGAMLGEIADFLAMPMKDLFVNERNIAVKNKEPARETAENTKTLNAVEKNIMEDIVIRPYSRKEKDIEAMKTFIAHVSDEKIENITNEQAQSFIDCIGVEEECSLIVKKDGTFEYVDTNPYAADFTRITDAQKILSIIDDYANEHITGVSEASEQMKDYEYIHGIYSHAHEKMLMSDFVDLNKNDFLSSCWLPENEYGAITERTEKRLGEFFKGLSADEIDLERGDRQKIGYDDIFDRMMTWVRGEFPEKEENKVVLEAASRIIFSNVDFGVFEPENYDDKFKLGNGAEMRFDVSDAAAKEVIMGNLSSMEDVQKFVTKEAERQLNQLVHGDKEFRKALVEQRISDAYEVAKSIRGEGYIAGVESDRETAIKALFNEIKDHYDNDEGLMAYGEKDGIEFERLVSYNELALLIRGRDAIEHGVKSLEFVRPTGKQIESVIDEKIPFDDIARGYGILKNRSGNMIRIECRNMGVFDSDMNAARQWEIETGGRILENGRDFLIPEDDPQYYNLQYYTYLDLPEVREKLKDYLLERPIEFDWSKFTEEQFNSFKNELLKQDFHPDWKGTVGIGSIHIEFVHNENDGWIDTNYYVLGENNGYGNMDGTLVPYAHYDGKQFDFQTFTDSNYSIFKYRVENQLLQNLIKNPHLKKETLRPTVDWNDKQQAMALWAEKSLDAGNFSFISPDHEDYLIDSENGSFQLGLFTSRASDAKHEGYPNWALEQALDPEFDVDNDAIGFHFIASENGDSCDVYWENHVQSAHPGSHNSGYISDGTLPDSLQQKIIIACEQVAENFCKEHLRCDGIGDAIIRGGEGRDTDSEKLYRKIENELEKQIKMEKEKTVPGYLTVELKDNNNNKLTIQEEEFDDDVDVTLEAPDGKIINSLSFKENASEKLSLDTLQNFIKASNLVFEDFEIVQESIKKISTAENEEIQKKLYEMGYEARTSAVDLLTEELKHNWAKEIVRNETGDLFVKDLEAPDETTKPFDKEELSIIVSEVIDSIHERDDERLRSGDTFDADFSYSMGQLRELQNKLDEFTITQSVTFPCGFTFPDGYKTEAEQDAYREQMYQNLKEKYGFHENDTETGYWPEDERAETSFNINFTVSVPDEIKADVAKVNEWIKEQEKFLEDEYGAFINWQGGERKEQKYESKKAYEMEKELDENFGTPSAETFDPASADDIRTAVWIMDRVELTEDAAKEIFSFYNENTEQGLYVSPAGNIFLHNDYTGDTMRADGEILESGHRFRMMSEKEKNEYIERNYDDEAFEEMIGQFVNPEKTLSDALTAAFATLDSKKDYWQSLLDHDANPRGAILMAANDANLGDNLNWLLDNVSEEELKEIFSDKEYAAEVFDIAKKSVTHDIGLWKGGQDIGFEGFKRIARLCDRVEDADKYYGEILGRAFGEPVNPPVKKLLDTPDSLAYYMAANRKSDLEPHVTLDQAKDLLTYSAYEDYKFYVGEDKELYILDASEDYSGKGSLASNYDIVTLSWDMAIKALDEEYRNYTKESYDTVKSLYEQFKVQEIGFTDDIDKMYDFDKISKEEFLSSYSYISEEEYDATARYLKENNLSASEVVEMLKEQGEVLTADEDENISTMNRAETLSDKREPVELASKIAAEKEREAIPELFKKEIVSLMKSDNLSVKDPFIATKKIFDSWKKENPNSADYLNDYLKEKGCTSKEGFEKFFRETIGFQKREQPLNLAKRISQNKVIDERER